MKLRFHSNTLRFRLSQSDVAQLKESARVEESVVFREGDLRYAIELRPADGIAASFDRGRILVTVPETLGRDWIEGDQEGIENGEGSPKIVIEKDFQCLHQEGAAEADAFPNPLMDKF